MSANPKPRRFQKDWRKKEVNHAKLKYTKDQILSLFSPSDLPSIKIPENLFSTTSLSPIILSTSPPPQCENSRKSQKTTKREKTLTFKIEISKNNIEEDPDPDLEQEDPINSNFLSQQNSKRDIQESYIKYNEDLLNSHLAQKNPFADIIFSNCLIKDHFVYPTSKSFEKIWFYKDALNRTQGPFSSVEMFNWTAAGYFTTHLMLSRDELGLFFALSSYC